MVSPGGIEPVIKVRKSTSNKANGRMPRKLVAQEYLRDMPVLACIYLVSPSNTQQQHNFGIAATQPYILGGIAAPIVNAVIAIYILFFAIT